MVDKNGKFEPLDYKQASDRGNIENQMFQIAGKLNGIEEFVLTNRKTTVLIGLFGLISLWDFPIIPFLKN